MNAVPFRCLGALAIVVGLSVAGLAAEPAAKPSKMEKSIRAALEDVQQLCERDPMLEDLAVARIVPGAAGDVTMFTLETAGRQGGPRSEQPAGRILVRVHRAAANAPTPFSGASTGHNNTTRMTIDKQDAGVTVSTVSPDAFAHARLLFLLRMEFARRELTLTGDASRIPEQTLQRIKKRAPDDWAVHVFDPFVIVRRKERVFAFDPADLKAPARAVDDQDDAEHEENAQVEGTLPEDVPRVEHRYAVILLFAPAMGVEEYDSKLAQNRATQRRLERYEQRLREVPGQFGRYFPRSREERELVREYEHARHSLPFNDLPARHDGQRSIWVSDSLGPTSLGPPLRIVPGGRKRECDRVRENLLALFSKYNDRRAAGPTPAPAAGADAPKANPAR